MLIFGMGRPNFVAVVTLYVITACYCLVLAYLNKFEMLRDSGVMISISKETFKNFSFCYKNGNVEMYKRRY